MKRTVVVVDDLPDLRQILRLILEHGGPFRVVGEGGTGDEAVALAADLHPDLLLMDVEMPGGRSGWSVLPRIREVAPETAVVILSGSRVDPSAAGARGLAAAVLEKGLPPHELVAALVEVLGAAPAPAPPELPAPATPGAAPGPSADALEAFAAVAGHDLAQPLQVAYGYLEMLKTDFGASLDPTAASWLDAAIASLERMRGLVQDVVGFGRAGSEPPVPEAVDLAAAVDEAVAGLGGGGADIEVRRGSLPVVVADRAHVVGVLTALLDNARTFGAPPVSVSAETTEDAWIVTVADAGAGVPPAVADRLFEPFRRGTSSGRGAGLGLARGRKLVEAGGGRLWLDAGASDPGATFRFSLPRPPGP